MLTYLISRYSVFFLQFILSLVLASKLDPYHLGLWSFVLLLLNYINQFDFGITHAFNVFLSQKNDDYEHSNLHYSNSLFLILALGLFVLLLSIFSLLFPAKILVKYDIQYKIILIGIIGALQYVNNLFMTLYRINNSFKEITINQSVIVVLSFLILFLDENYAIINTLFIVYIASNIISLVLYIKNSPLQFKLNYVQKSYISTILKKAGVLFIFNSSTYFIIISTRTFISSYYSVKDFGVFSLAFSLANAFFLLINSIGFIIYPSLLSTFSDSSSSSERLIDKYRSINNKYLLASHLILFISIPLFFICKNTFLKYDGLIDNLTFISLTILINAHSFTSTTFLVATKNEFIVALISLLTLFINILGCFILVHFMNVEFKYVIFITTFSNLLLAMLCGIYVNKKFIHESKIRRVANDIFPYSLLIPYIIYLVISIIGSNQLLILPILIFIVINKRNIKELIYDIFNYFKNGQIRLK
jgi:O-antigen/teichoic acid export membrane protein